MKINILMSQMTPIRRYIEQGDLPKDKNKAEMLLRKAPRFVIQNGVLYNKKGFSTSLLRSVEMNEARKILR